MVPGFGALQWMIFWELLRVFSLTLVGLTGMFVIVGLVQQVSQLGLGFVQIVQIIPLFVPSTLPYTVPATTLFAACVVYGRLANDNEVVAIKAAGIDLLTMLRPAVLLGVLTTAATLGLSFTVIPRTLVQMQEEILREPEEVLYNMLRRDRNLGHSNARSQYVMYVRDVQGKRLLDVVIKRRTKERVKVVPKVSYREDYDYLARTSQARLSVDLDRRILTVDADRWAIADSNASDVHSSGTQPYEIELPDIFSTKEIKTRPNALEWPELGARLADLRKERETITANQKANAAAGAGTQDPAALTHVQELQVHYNQQVLDNDRNVRNVEYEYAIRLALAFSCLVFALIGAPVGMLSNRADYLSTFVVCFLPTILVYYPIVLSGRGLAIDGKILPALGAWAANIVVGAGALVLVFRAIKR